jgi:hypothetical protein
MNLNSWQERLLNHFVQLRERRLTLQKTHAILYALEHGLTESEVGQLRQDIHEWLKNSGPARHHFLVWAVYSAEIGYQYSGEEYWMYGQQSTVLRQSANLNSDHCPQCDVRHLCSDYWTPQRHIPAKQSLTNKRFDDVQLRLKSRKSDNTWLAESQIASYLTPHTPLLIRWSSAGFRVLDALTVGTVVRIVGGILSDNHDDYPVLTCATGADLIVLGK